jgi:hypothetical protein
MQDTYIVTAPDGTVYEVETPPGASEDEILQQVQANHGPKLTPEDEQAYAQLAADPKSTLADLQGFLRPRGLDLDDATGNAFLKARNNGARVTNGVSYKLPKAPPRGKNSLRENIRGAAASFVEGFIPGSSKAARGTREVVLNAVRAPFTEEEFDPATAYDKGEQQITDDRLGFEHENPDAADGLNLGGMVTSFMLPSARLIRGGGLGAGFVNGAATGAGYGALSGALNDTGDGRVANALGGAVFGSAVGGGLPLAARGAGSVASSARRNVPGVSTALNAVDNAGRFITRRPLQSAEQRLQGDASAQAERMLGDMLPNGTISTGMGTGSVQATPDAIANEVARRAALNVPAMPADTTEPARRITAWALQGNGPMASRARSVLSARQAQAGQRVRGHLAEELGAPVDPILEAEAITRRAQDAAEPAYRQAYAEGSPTVITPELAEIMQRPAFQDSLPQAYRNIQNRGNDPEAMGFAMLPDGSVTLSPQPTFEAFDQVVRTLNKSIPRDPLTRRPILDNESGGVNDVMQRLDEYLKDSNDSYRAAKGNFADEMAIKDALANGQNVSNVTGPEVEAQLRTMPDHAQEAWMTGARTALADVATQTSQKYPTANVPHRVRQSIGLSGSGDPALGDVQKLQAIEQMSGRPGVMNRLDDRLEAEDQAFKTFSETYGNSKTQPRQAMDEALSSDALQVARNALYGNWVGAASAFLLKGNPAGTARFKQGVQDRIAEIMTATNPANVRELSDAIMRRAETDDQFRQLLNRAGIGPARVVALQTAGLDTAPPPLDEDPELVP